MSLTDTPLARLRKARGLTQRELSAMAGVTQPQICRFEKGRHAPAGMAVARRLAAALGVSLDALWGDANTPGSLPQLLPQQRPARDIGSTRQPSPVRVKNQGRAKS